MGRKCVDTNQLFIDGLRIPVEDRIGEENRGFEYILHGMNPERILIACEAIGLGRAALSRAAKYAGEREVFNRSIGKNQGIQHPLAKNWVELEAATLLYQKAAWLYDQGQPCGAEANAAKFFCAEAGFKAAETAVLTHGGFGYAKEYQVAPNPSKLAAYGLTLAQLVTALERNTALSQRERDNYYGELEVILSFLVFNSLLIFSLNIIKIVFSSI